MAIKEEIMKGLQSLEGHAGRGVLSRVCDSEMQAYIEKLHRSGVSYADIAEEINRTAKVKVNKTQVMFFIARYRKQHSLPPTRVFTKSRGILSRLFDFEMQAYLEKLHRGGISYAAIADEISQTAKTKVNKTQVMLFVSRYRNQHSLPPVRIFKKREKKETTDLLEVV